MDYADEARDTHFLNEFLAQPKLPQEIEGAKRFLGIHPDQLEPNYLVFSMQINGESQRFSLPIVEGDSDGSMTETRAEELAESLGAERLYHGHKVFLRSFKNQAEGTVVF